MMNETSSLSMGNVALPDQPHHGSTSDTHSTETGTTIAHATRRPSRWTFRTMSYPRKRAVTACENCRVRKTKCGNERPRCSACKRHGLACSYDPRIDHSSFDPASLLILEKLEGVMSRLDRLEGPSQGTNPNTTSEAIQCGPQNDFDFNTHISTSHTVNRHPGDAGSAPPTVHQLSSADSDSLRVWGPFASVDYVLTWPVFGDQFPSDLLSRELLLGKCAAPSNKTDDDPDQRPIVRQEEAPYLVQRFLQFVHPKNPIFHIDELREQARHISDHGFSWDATSCLILLACALGAISMPFDPTDEEEQLYGRSSLEETATRRQTAETYFQAARQRIGLLDLEPGLAASQCHMLSGIYLFYTLRPIQGWSAFHQAGSLLTLHLRAQALLDRHSSSSSFSSSPEARSDIRLEQRLYWTALKSECEIRTQIDVPQSTLCNLDYPYLFPSPPLTLSDDAHIAPTNDVTSPTEESPSSVSSLQSSEEQSWFYYLSEIALRRIETRILNAFYKEHHDTWTKMNAKDMLSFAANIEDQLSSWHSSLPEPIRFDNLAANQELDELRVMTGGRSLIIRALLYRPFLYLVVHSSESEKLDPCVQNLAHKCLSVCLAMNSGFARSHRHHGTWYMLRESIIAALVLVAAQRHGLVAWVAAGSTPQEANETPTPYGRAVQVCLDTLRYWEAESAGDVARSRELLEKLYYDQ